MSSPSPFNVPSFLQSNQQFTEFNSTTFMNSPTPPSLPVLQSTPSQPYPLLQRNSFRDRSSLGEIENGNFENKEIISKIGIIGQKRVETEPIGLGFQLDPPKLVNKFNFHGILSNQSQESPSPSIETHDLPMPGLVAFDDDKFKSPNSELSQIDLIEGKEEIIKVLENRVKVLEETVENLTTSFHAKLSNLSLEFSTLRSLFLTSTAKPPPTPASAQSSQQFYYSPTTERESFISDREKERETSTSPILTLRSPSPIGTSTNSAIRAKAYLNVNNANSNGIISPGFSNGPTASNNGILFGEQRPTSSSSSISNFLNSNSHQTGGNQFNSSNNGNASPNLLSSPNISSVIDNWKSSLVSPSLNQNQTPISNRMMTSHSAIGLGSAPVHSPNLNAGNSGGNSMMRSISANGLSRNLGSPNLGGGGFGGVGEDKRRSTFGAVGSPGEARGRPDSTVESANWENGSVGTTTAGNSPLIGMNGSAGGGITAGSLGGKWEVLGVGSDLFRCIVKYGLGPPTKIQMKAIPCVLRNQDVVAQAPSIQERIQSYVVPALQLIHNSILNGEPNKGLSVLIITATVDQAAQAQRLSSGLGNSLGIKTGLCVGIVKVNELQVEANELISTNANILVGTPIKILSLFKLGKLNLNFIKLLIIDECDQLIARNLSEYLVAITKFLPSSNASLTTISRSPIPNSNSKLERSKSPLSFHTAERIIERQTAIFSCTVPQDVLNFAANLNLREPVRVLVRREGIGLGNANSSPTPIYSQSTTPMERMEPPPAQPIRSLSSIKQYFIYLPNAPVSRSASAKEHKLEALLDVVEDLDFSNSIIFCNSLESIEAVSFKLASRGLDVLSLHHEMGSIARNSIVNKFKLPSSIGTKAKKCLIVMDTLIKTLEFHSISLIINYDLPRIIEDYSHRVGFLATPGLARPGILINLITPGADIDTLRTIESSYRIKILELPTSH